jgi:4-hydroxy-L-threonine phosphate dehydrogenase PdxA
MKNKPILIVPGETESIFFEILFKSIRSNKFKSPLILITSIKILQAQMKRFKFKKKIRIIDLIYLKKNKLDNLKINLINIDNYISNKIKKNTINTNAYIKNCFDIAFKILKTNFSNKLLNGPINKSLFLNRKFPGMTEYISSKFNIKKNAMLIYNEDLSVCPLTTHLPLKLVSNKISRKLIKEKTILINDFFLKNRGFKPKIAVTGLNPHCESTLKFNEDDKILVPAIKTLRKNGYKIYGPFSADTIFLKQNRDKYNVILGMYHDQVLSPIKTLKEYNAINVTLGLPFYRVSPDHGPNKKMINKNLSNSISLTKSIKFLDQQ